jgi:hypothetical protein
MLKSRAPKPRNDAARGAAKRSTPTHSRPRWHDNGPRVIVEYAARQPAGADPLIDALLDGIARTLGLKSVSSGCGFGRRDITFVGKDAKAARGFEDALRAVVIASSGLWDDDIDVQIDDADENAR